MKTQLAVDFYRTFSFSTYPLEVAIKEENNNNHGNRNLPPAPNRYSRPVSVPAGWGPASYPKNDSRLPSSLNDWLASKNALAIG
ncbi:MAG TPA: hypothetical protein VMA35_07105 [Candidatus Sulfopaludibacter sp.]|nr:hypothetical protein [Candidatus Sulfopaludibacter sp.]